MKKTNRGFTLVELIVVIGIISLLTSVVFASASVVRKRAQDTKTLADIQQIYFAMEVYYEQHGAYPNPQEVSPILPPNTNPDRIYCIGFPGPNTCTFGSVLHNGSLQLAVNNEAPNKLLAAVSNIFPNFDLSRMLTYKFTNPQTGNVDSYRGYFYTCALDSTDPNYAAQLTQTWCAKDAYLIYPDSTGLHPIILGSEPKPKTAATPTTSDSPPLSGSCSPSPSSGGFGTQVHWQALASGGYGAPPVYSYNWTGNGGLSSGGDSVDITYNSGGTYYAQVTINDGINPALKINCSPNVTITPGAPTILPPAPQCTVSPTTATAGQSVTWTVNPNASTALYTIQWSGTDSLSGSAESINKTYATDGVKTGSVTVTDDNDSATTVACDNSVTVGTPPPPPPPPPPGGSGSGSGSGSGF
jgi:prepilin-type N-terminal cleavage/methylation domain-containing protein